MKKHNQQELSNFSRDVGIHQNSNVNLNLIPKNAFKGLVLIASVLLFIHLILSLLVSIYLDRIVWLNYVDSLLNMNSERNIPSFFSVLVLTACSGVLAFIYKAVNPENKKQWLFLSLIFLFLAFDEAMEIHEKVNVVLKNAITSNSAALTFPWVLPYLVFFAIVAIYLAPFILKLPKYLFRLIVLSGFVFVTGAAGLEIVEGIVAQNFGEYSFLNLALMGIEEYMEIVGVLIFIYALLTYISYNSNSITINLKKRSVSKTTTYSQQPEIA